MQGYCVNCCHVYKHNTAVKLSFTMDNIIRLRLDRKRPRIRSSPRNAKINGGSWLQKIVVWSLRTFSCYLPAMYGLPIVSPDITVNVVRYTHNVEGNAN